MAKKGWSRPFEDPITLPNGKTLVTLKDAADYIMKLLKADAMELIGEGSASLAFPNEQCANDRYLWISRNALCPLTNV